MVWGSRSLSLLPSRWYRDPVAGTLPRPEDLPEGSTLAEAVRVVEMLLRTAIISRRITVDVLLGGTTERQVTLPWYPIREPKLDGTGPGEQWWAELDVGLIGTSVLPLSDWPLEYQIGFDPEQIHSLVIELVRRLARYQAGQDENPGDLLEVAKAWRARRNASKVARSVFRV